MLSWKYGGPGRVEDRLAWYSEHGSEPQRQAAEAFRERQAEGRLPSPVPGAEQVAFFLDGSYAARPFRVRPSS